MTPSNGRRPKRAETARSLNTCTQLETENARLAYAYLVKHARGMITDSGSIIEETMTCSHMGPMPEVLGDAGIYFDPEDATSIARALRELVESPDLRTLLAQAAFDRAQAFSWKRCADETLGSPARVAREPITGGNL